MTTKTTVFQLAGLVRLPLISRGRTDLEALGALAVGSSKVNPDGDFNTTTTTAFGVAWGIGIGYWFSPHWQLSGSITNPLVTYATRKQQDDRERRGAEHLADADLLGALLGRRSGEAEETEARDEDADRGEEADQPHEALLGDVQAVEVLVEERVFERVRRIELRKQLLDLS